MNKNVADTLMQSRLCRGMEEHQVISLLKHVDCRIQVYQKTDFLFQEGTPTDRLYVLLNGKVGIFKNSYSGRRMMLTSIEEPGDMFGEIYLFLEKETYDVEAQALERTVVLGISQSIFDQARAASNEAGSIMQNNLVRIFAEKAYLLSNRVKLLGCSTIREKIARFLVEEQDADGMVQTGISREKMAELLNVTRPSLSRELGNMEKEQIIRLDGKRILVLDQEALEISGKWR